jgi:Zn-dependent protease
MAMEEHRHLRPDDSETRLLESTVGPGRYRVLTRRPLTIVVAPHAYVPALMCALTAAAVEGRHGLGAAVVAGVIAGVGLAVAVAAHEAGHLLFGRHVRGLVPRILLLHGGGGASIVEGRFQDPGGAAFFAAGGPAASLALLLLYAVGAGFLPWHAAQVGLLLPALATGLLLIVNLLPVAPTDGYALFRSALWAETGSRAEAERRALAWSRAVLAFGIVLVLELVTHYKLLALGLLFAVATLTVQHHAVVRRAWRETSGR